MINKDRYTKVYQGIPGKKGATYGGWIEVILFVILFVAVLAIIGTGMNTSYDKSEDLTFGIVTEDTLDDVKDVSTVFEEATVNGSTSFSSLGILVLTKLPKMISSVGSLIWTFVSGGFINSIVNAMNLGDYSSIFIIIFKLLYFIGLGLILIKILTKVVI